MAIFAIFQVSHPEKLGPAIKIAYPEDHLDLGNNEWMISDKATAIDVSNKLGVSDASNGIVIIVGIANYYGRAPNNIWDWMKTKTEAVGG